MFVIIDKEKNDMRILKDAAKERERMKSYDVPDCPLKPLNRPQIEAVKNALTQRFTVIQGPPGMVRFTVILILIFRDQ